jgi:hypothetical protein
MARYIEELNENSAPATSDWMWIVDVNAASDDMDQKLSLSKLALLGTANVFTETQTLTGHVLVGTTTDSAQLTVKAGNTDTVGLVVDTAPTPTVDIQQWKVNGTVTTVVDKAGYLGVGLSDPLTQIHIENQGSSSDDGQNGLTLGLVRPSSTSSNSQSLFLQSGWSPGGSAIVNWNTWALRGYQQDGDGSGSSLYFTYQENDTVQQADWNDTTAAMVLSNENNLLLGGTAKRAGTEGTKTLHIFDGTAPTSTLAAGCSFYSTSGEMRVMDAAGNATLLSPHDENGRWIYDSVDTVTGKTLRIDMELMMKKINEHFGWDLVKEFTKALEAA